MKLISSSPFLLSLPTRAVCVFPGWMRGVWIGYTEALSCVPRYWKLVFVRNGWGWEYSDQSPGSQKRSKQIVQRPRFKSHPCFKLGVGLPTNQFKVFSLVKWTHTHIPALPPLETVFRILWGDGSRLCQALHKCTVGLGPVLYWQSLGSLPAISWGKS